MLIIQQYIDQHCVIDQHVNLEYGMYLVLWSCTVFCIHGTTASPTKSLIAVLRNVKIATHDQRGQECNGIPINSVLAEGPNDINCVCMIPM